MNEPLCRALVQARLSEEDVAARLEVDPKTVRRWLGGRVPYLRYRWALAVMLGKDEAELWPELRSAQTRPEEVRAIYPHLDSVPREVWLALSNSAENEISILTGARPAVIDDPVTLSTLGERARNGVRMRICLADHRLLGEESEGHCAAIDQPEAVPESGMRLPEAAEIRLYPAPPYHWVFRGDSHLLVAQQAIGIPAGRAPVLHLQQAADDGLFATYLTAFESIWASAEPRR